MGANAASVCASRTLNAARVLASILHCSGGSGSNGGQFSNNLDSSTFGQIIKGTVGTGSTNWPRQIQLGFKFIY